MERLVWIYLGVRHSLWDDNHADRQPSDHITSEPSEICKNCDKKVSKNGVEQQTVAGNPGENGKQAQEVYLGLKKKIRKQKRRSVACVRVELGS